MASRRSHVSLEPFQTTQTTPPRKPPHPVKGSCFSFVGYIGNNYPACRAAGVREPFSAVRLLAETVGADELLRSYGISREVAPCSRNHSSVTTSEFGTFPSSGP